MNTLESIFSRKSVRNFNENKLTSDELQTILKAAYAAPVGKAEYNSLELTVISNSTLLQKIDAVAAKLFDRPDYHPLYNAPTLIVVSSTIPPAPMDNLAYSNAAIVVQNMTLAAVELGVGSCHIWGAIMALKNSPELLKELNLPDGFLPCCAIALGKSDEKYELREITAERIKTIILE